MSYETYLYFHQFCCSYDHDKHRACLPCQRERCPSSRRPFLRDSHLPYPMRVRQLHAFPIQHHRSASSCSTEVNAVVLLSRRVTTVCLRCWGTVPRATSRHRRFRLQYSTGWSRWTVKLPTCSHIAMWQSIIPSHEQLPSTPYSLRNGTKRLHIMTIAPSMAKAADH